MENKNMEELVEGFQKNFKESIVIARDEEGHCVLSVDCTPMFAGDMIKELIRQNVSIGKAMSKSMVSDMVEACFDKDNGLNILEKLKKLASNLPDGSETVN